MGETPALLNSTARASAWESRCALLPASASTCSAYSCRTIFGLRHTACVRTVSNQMRMSLDTGDRSNENVTGPVRWYGLDVSQLVKQWYAGMPNNGLFLQAGYSTAAYFFASSEAADVNLRPRLVVQYYIPGPSPHILRDAPIPLPDEPGPQPGCTPVPIPPDLADRLRELPD